MAGWMEGLVGTTYSILGVLGAMMGACERNQMLEMESMYRMET